MNKVCNVILGSSSLLWFSITYPALFEFLFINISAEPVIGPCREAFGAESCLPLARLFLWLIEFPLNAVIFGSFAAALVMIEKHVKLFQLDLVFLSTGLVLGFITLVLWAPGGDVHISYYLVAIFTYLAFIIAGVWAIRHLTRQSSQGRA
jgi:hypothetical protein